MEREFFTPVLPFKLGENRTSNRPSVLVKPTGTLIPSRPAAKGPKIAYLAACLPQEPAKK